MSVKEICLFGSSVNPPTKAHVGILQHLQDQKIFDEIWLLPVYRHAYSSKSDLVDYDLRMEMCKLATKHLNVTVSDLEKRVFDDVNGKHRKRQDFGTFDIALWLKERYPDHQFHFVLGSDAFSDLCHGMWKNGDKLAGLFKFQVIQRDELHSLESLQSMKYAQNATFHKLKSIDPNVSSTKARTLASVEKLQAIVPTPVALFIKEHKLYGFKT